MRRRLLPALALFFAATGPGEAARAHAHRLMQLEARMVAGEHAASEARARLIAEAPKRMTVDWTLASERHHAALLVLSGAAPALLAACLDQPSCGADDRALLEAARLYGEGRTAQAPTAMEAAAGHADILPDLLNGALALARAQGLAAGEPAAALRQFDLARLYGTGTLIEEVALRRSLLLLAPAQEGERVAMLARHYLTRFRHSIFRESFLPRLTALLAQLGDGVNGAREAIDLLPEPARAALRLDKAREAALALDRGALRAEVEALDGTTLDARERARLSLYEASVKVAGPDRSEALTTLRGLSREEFDPVDAHLREAALEAAHHTQSAPAPAGKPSRPSGVDARASLAEAERALRESDALLSRPPP